MISREKLDSEILELETRHDTTYATCERLAWLYIVRDHVTGQQAAQPTPLSVDPSSEFLQAVDGKGSVQVFAVMDDLMDTLRATAPRVYDHIMRKVRDIDRPAAPLYTAGREVSIGVFGCICQCRHGRNGNFSCGGFLFPEYKNYLYKNA